MAVWETNFVELGISEKDCSLVLSQPITLNEPLIKLEIVSNYGEITKIRGRVVKYDRDPTGEFTLGIEFLKLDEATRQSIIRQMYSPEDSWQYDHIQSGGVWGELFIFLSTPLKTFVKDKVLRRTSPRFNISLPCKIMLGNKNIRGTAKNISITGMTIDLNISTKLPSEINMIITRKTSSIILSSRVIWQKQGKKVMSCGVEILKPFQGGYIWERLGF